jgi:hypothetical protein
MMVCLPVVVLCHGVARPDRLHHLISNGEGDEQGQVTHGRRPQVKSLVSRNLMLV